MKNKIFVLYITVFSIGSNIHLFWKNQIILLDVEKVTIFFKYANYTNIFLLVLVAELNKHTSIKTHFFDLINNKQLLYSLIYSVGLIKLKTLKIYIKTNLTNAFIRFSKSPASALVLFIWKKNNRFGLYIEYQDLNNLTLKNWYLLPLIGEFFNCLSYAKHFT